jgi:hypothetical protein
LKPWGQITEAAVKRKNSQPVFFRLTILLGEEALSRFPEILWNNK